MKFFQLRFAFDPPTPSLAPPTISTFETVWGPQHNQAGIACAWIRTIEHITLHTRLIPPTGQLPTTQAVMTLARRTHRPRRHGRRRSLAGPVLHLPPSSDPMRQRRPCGLIVCVYRYPFQGASRGVGRPRCIPGARPPNRSGLDVPLAACGFARCAQPPTGPGAVWTAPLRSA